MTEIAQTRATGRVLAYWGLGAVVSVCFVLARDLQWQSDAHLHTLLETLATVLALLVGVVALIRYASRPSNIDLFIAAAFTHSRILEHPSVRTEFPVLAQALRVLGSPPIRHMGTIGGNIVTASPAGDTLPALYALDAEVEIRSRDQSRRLPIGDFIRGPGSVALNTGEILAGVWLRKAPHWNIQHYEKVGRRKAQACAVASMAALLRVTDAGRIERIRLAWGSVGPFVITAPDVEAALTGRVLSLESLESVRGMVEHAVAPIDDLRASAEYRRRVAGALLLRLLSSHAGSGGTVGLSGSGSLEN